MTFRLPCVLVGARFSAIAMAGLLCACLGDRDLSTAEPSFYRSLATKDAQVDATMAASMISGYRTNNGLTAVSIDPELMKLAETQAQAMASRDTLSHDIARSFHDRSKAATTARAPRRRMSGPAIIRWRKPSLAGAILRPIAPTCCSRARPAWASPRLMRRNPNTKYSGRSSWRRPTSGADSRGGRHRGRPTLNRA